MQEKEKKAKSFKSPNEFRKWLDTNHDKVTEIWVILNKKKSNSEGIAYSEALDQALCYGWIDSSIISIDENRWMKRFTPRKARSIWSLVNIKRVEELKGLGLVKPEGLNAFNARLKEKSGIYSYEQKNEAKLSRDYEEKFKSNKKAWDFFRGQARSYKRTTVHWVMRAKRDETRLKRLDKLIKESGSGSRLAQFTYSLWVKKKLMGHSR